MKITGLSRLFKWENLHNWWLTKCFFAPLYIYGKTKSIPRTSMGLRSANSIQQGKAKRDNQGNVKQQQSRWGGKHNSKQARQD